MSAEPHFLTGIFLNSGPSLYPCYFIRVQTTVPDIYVPGSVAVVGTLVQARHRWRGSYLVYWYV